MIVSLSIAVVESVVVSANKLSGVVGMEAHVLPVIVTEVHAARVVAYSEDLREGLHRELT